MLTFRVLRFEPIMGAKGNKGLTLEDQFALSTQLIKPIQSFVRRSEA